MASDQVKEFTADTFSDAMEEGVVLVDFWAPWCGPCRMQGPILEEVAKQVGAEAVVGKVNVDSEGPLAASFGIQSIPALLIFRDGKVVQQFIGVQTATTLQKALTEAQAQKSLG